MLTCEHTPVKTIRTPQANINFADKVIGEDQFEYKRLMLCLVLALLSTFLLATIFPVTKCSFLPFREQISYISWHVDKLVHFAFSAGQVTVLMCVLRGVGKLSSEKTLSFVFLFGVGASISTELIQGFIPCLTPTFWDAAANIAGVFLRIIVGKFLMKRINTNPLDQIRRSAKFPRDLIRLQYEDLEKDRQNILNLKRTQYFKKFINEV